MKIIPKIDDRRLRRKLDHQIRNNPRQIQIALGTVLLGLGILLTASSSFIMFGLILVGVAMIVRGLNEFLDWF